MTRGRWPAPITRAEQIQLTVLFAILAASAVVAFAGSSQLITPVSYLWLAPVTLAGCGLGVWLSQILTRVNRDHNSRGENRGGAFAVILLGGTVFYCMAWSLADGFEFRNGGAVAEATYPVVRLTRERHDRNHWVMINPSGLMRGSIVPISMAQYRALVAGCGTPDGDCTGAGLCVTLPIERAPGGAVRIMATETSAPPDHRPIARCTPP